MTMRFFKKLLLFSSLLLFFTLVSFNAIDRHFEIAKSLETFASLYRDINRYYVDEVSPTDLVNSAIHSMLGSLDPYTNYIPEDQIEDYRTMATGEYGGVGMEVAYRKEKIIVTMIFEGYPAHKQGVRIGDEIVKVNGVEVKGRPLQNIERLLKGQSESAVRLALKRYGHERLLDFTLNFEKVKEKNVPYYGMVTKDIGLIKLSDFTQKASIEVKTAMLELKNQGATSLIIDLRGNPGGLLNESVNISNLFLPRGYEIVAMRGRTDDWSKNYQALNEPVDVDIPLAVLIDKNSASASEIVSGVIQDYDRGVLVGQRSFGKGLVQTTTPLSYNAQLKVTVAKYYIPSGRCIQELDYSRKNDLGEAGKLADSLRVAFKTRRSGRTVYDGAGVEPDVVTSVKAYAPITQSLIGKELIFEYANIFRHQYDTIPSAKQFKLTDAQYQEFVKWLKGKDYAYETKVEESLENLVASAKEDRYYEDIKLQITTLEKQVKSNKESDLYKFKKEIAEVLEHEIAVRYFFQTGSMEATFDDNQDILTAVRILKDSKKYREILAGNP
jgi:carboxyl-terminal processing protease